MPLEKADRASGVNNMEGSWSLDFPLKSRKIRGNRNDKASKKVGKGKGLDRCHSNHKKTSDSEHLNFQKILSKNKIKNQTLSKTCKKVNLIHKASKQQVEYQKIYFPSKTRVPISNPLYSKPINQIFSKSTSYHPPSLKTNSSPKASHLKPYPAKTNYSNSTSLPLQPFNSNNSSLNSRLLNNPTQTSSSEAWR